MSSSSSSSNYYDLDAILSEEELVPCWNKFDFSYLAHLDPDHQAGDTPSSNKLQSPRQSSSPQATARTTTNLLPEGTKLKIPLWALRSWAPVGFVQMTLPRHYHRKAREKLQADPCQVDLSKRNHQFFGTGVALLQVWELTVRKLGAQQVARNQRRQWQTQLDTWRAEAHALRVSLVATYTGDRLRRTMDWSWSAVGDDVSSLTDSLTVWEGRLFGAGAQAVQDWEDWQQQGKRRAVPTRRVVTPPLKRGMAEEEEAEAPSKRPRV